MANEKSSGNLKMIGLACALAGATGSLIFTLQAGKNNTSVLLISMFLIWVLSPFAGMFLFAAIERLWPRNATRLLHFLMIVLSGVALMFYSHFLEIPRLKPAFIYLAVPAVSWLALIGGLIAAIRKGRGKPTDIL